jgi:hypothetical protein
MRHQTVSSRRTDLRKHGYTTYYFVDGVIQRRLNISGAPARIELATPLGKMVIRDNMRIRLGPDSPTKNYRGKGNTISEEVYRSRNWQECARLVLTVMCQYTP